MRVLFAFVLVALAGCRAPYTSDLADLTVWPEDFPPVGTEVAALEMWFHEHDYAPGPKVYAAEASLRRRPGTPLVYALEADKRWWLTRSRSVRDFCVTTKTIYYRLGPDGGLLQAVQNHRSQC